MKKGPGRPNLGRTKTLKDREVNLYLPTVEMVNQWKTEAEKHGLSLSKFVVEVVDDALRKNPKGVTPREQLEAELKRAYAELELSIGKWEDLREVQKRNEETIAEYRERLFKPGKISEKAAEYVPRLAELIQDERVLPFVVAGKKFGIKDTDVNGFRALGSAADALARIGIIEKGILDWRWVGGARRKKQASPRTREP
ncbi:MAG: hypothetical protein WAS24_05680 [Thermoplasmata archaeon]